MPHNGYQLKFMWSGWWPWLYVDRAERVYYETEVLKALPLGRHAVWSRPGTLAAAAARYPGFDSAPYAAEAAAAGGGGDCLVGEAVLRGRPLEGCPLAAALERDGIATASQLWPRAGLGGSLPVEGAQFPFHGNGGLQAT